MEPAFREDIKLSARMPQGTGVLESFRGDARWTALAEETVAGVVSLNFHLRGEYSAISYLIPISGTLWRDGGEKVGYAADHPCGDAAFSHWGGLVGEQYAVQACEKCMTPEKLREPRSNLLARFAHETLDDGVPPQKLIGLQVKGRTVGPSGLFPFFYD